MRISSFAVRRHLIIALLLGLVNWPVGAQVPAQKDPAKTPAIKLPSGAIIIVTKDPEAIDKPDAFYLTPEKYKEMSDQIDSLKKQIAAEKGMPPSICELDGRLETRGSQTIVKLRATFKFRTTVPRSIVFLGCQKAQPVEAKLEDGKLPLLAATDKGLSVHVDSIGEHVVRIDLELPLLPRGKGNEIGFDLGLPGAPITTLTFEAPAKVKRVTLVRREVGSGQTSGTDPPLDVKRYDADRPLPALGPITHLAVSWESAAQVGTGTVARSAEADVQVTIGEADILAEARIRLKGSAKEWRFLAPYNAEVVVGRAPPSAVGKPIDFPIDQAPDIVRPEPGKSEWRIRFREANAAELLVMVTARAARNRGADLKGRTTWAVGPFAALDVVQQAGTIHVKTLPHIRAAATLKGDTQRIDNSDDPNAEAIYRYRSLPTGPKDYVGPPLELDIRAAAGTVQTHVHHHLSLGEGGWRLRSEISVTPIRTEVETLDLEVPVPGVFEASTPKLVEGIVPVREIGPLRRIVQIKLAAPQRAEFSLTLDGFYPNLAASTQETMLVLPRLLNVFDRSGQVTVVVPDGFDLRGGAYQWEGDKPGVRMHSFDPPITMDRATTMSAAVSKTLSHVDLALKLIRADVRVESSVDVALGDRQTQVTQQLRYTFADRSLRKLRLRGPASVTGVTVNPGSIEINAPGNWMVNLPADPGKEATIVVAYSFPMLAAGDESRMRVPMLWPDGATSCENRVRILRDRVAVQHLLPALDSGPWQEMPITLVPGETSFPLLTLRGTGINLPLSLILRDAEASGPSMPLVWIDRILIQAQTGDAGQKYRARFHLKKWLARTLEFELPAGAVDAEVRINGLHAELRDAPSEGEVGRVLRVALPIGRDLPRLLIEVGYTLPVTSAENAWIQRYLPPRPRGRVAVAAVRWQVATPARSVPLSIGDAVFEERWTVRNGFFRPIAAHATGDLDKWISTGQEPDGSEVRAGWEMADTGVTAHQPSLAPLRIVAVPWILWQLAVSLSALVVGLILSRMPKRTVGVLLALMTAGMVMLGLLWPQPIGQVLAAAQPGLAILAIVLGLQRFFQWRYRRHLARMPGFTRIHAESALSRSNGIRPSREMSAINPPVGD